MTSLGQNAHVYTTEGHVVLYNVPPLIITYFSLMSSLGENPHVSTTDVHVACENFPPLFIITYLIEFDKLIATPILISHSINYNFTNENSNIF